jgi:Ran-binding protein 1
MKDLTKPEENKDIKKDNEESTLVTLESDVKRDVDKEQAPEEEGEILYSQRVKLFICNETLLEKGSTGEDLWRERGVGEIRLIRNREERWRVRIVMHQEKTGKILANHYLDTSMTLKKNTGSDRSWVWSAFDFSEGELVKTVFAVRFPNADLAKEFKTHFSNAQKEIETTSLVVSGDTIGTNEADGVTKATTTAEEK